MSQTATTTQTSTYTIDKAHTIVGFTVRHLMISKVHGSFSDFSGTVELDPSQPEQATINITVDLSTINTGVEQRDAHLRSADFFETDNHSTMTFKSSRVVKTGENEFDVFGDLILHGVTKEIKLKTEISNEVPSPFGGYKIGVSASGRISRDDFGITWNQAIETGGFMVGKDVDIQIEAELDRA